MATVFKRLGPYEIEREIGRGGMAVVFLATDTRSGRRVALKVVPRGADRESEDILEAEQLGAELQRQFSQVSTFVPAVFDHDLDQDYFYVAMEYLDGENLSALIARGPVPIDRAAAIASDLCRFIEDADGFDATVDGRQMHSLIHGDLTPRNIRITSAGQVQIFDFGIAKALSLSRKVTRNDFGSLAYLSPERLETTEVDRYSDFWAVGVLLYEMVRGERPYNAPDTRRLEKQILARRPPPALDERCPTGLRAIVAKLLAPDAADRYDSARAIREDLGRFTSGQAVLAEEEGWLDRGDAEPATRRTRPAPVDQEPTRRTTTPIVAGPAVGVSSAAASAKVGGPRSPARANRRSRLALVLGLLLMGVAVNEIWVAAAARRVVGIVPTRELDGLRGVWDQYDALSRRSYLRLAIAPLRESLIAQTSTLADRVIANYRTPMPSVREAQWKMAREALARAAGARPDNHVRAAMRYCDGHLHRINGEARLARRQLPTARQEFTEAVTAFREAAELRSNWPDPFLGLARTFIYGLEDVERGADALNQAQRLGYASGDRETAQLADGYRARGETLARSAQQLKGMPQERDHLTRAVDSYHQALTLYGSAIGFADVPRNLKKTQRELDQVERRLQELSPLSRIDVPADGATPWV